jgi:hypothetical protein
MADHGPKLGDPQDGLKIPIETPIEKRRKVTFSTSRLYNSLENSLKITLSRDIFE